MHPTVDEQLTGALRLLDVLEAEDELSTGGREVLGNVRRLLRTVQRSWAAQLPFHTADNVELTDLLTRTAPHADPAPVLPDDVPPPLDAVAVATRNAQLRALLSQVVTGLPPTPEGDAARAEIGDHLRRRVGTDPT